MGEDKPFSRSRPDTRQGSGTGKDTRKETGTEKVINIVYAMTSAVYRWILPSLRSLAEHNPDARIFIVCEDDTLPFPLPVDAEIINASGQEWFPETGINYNTYWTYINFLKVRYPSLLPVDKVIHLDIDTIICDDLSPLFDTALTGYWFAACPEYLGNYRLNGDTYYNAGVMVLNLEQMRKDGIETKMTDHLNTVKEPFADQNVWNRFGIAEGKAKSFDVRYNEGMTTGFTDNPAIVHYCGIRDWYTRSEGHRTEYLRKYKGVVLFTSTRPLERAENIKAVFDVYDGPKQFAQVDPWRHHPDIRSGKYDLMVCDEFPTESPGNAIMLSHGFAGCKTFGVDQPHPYHSAKNAHLINYAITASDDTIGIMAKCCGIQESAVLPLGVPQTDTYIGKHKGDGGTELAGKRAYFYAPTYRSKEETPLPDIDWEWLDAKLADDELLAVRPHPMTGRILQKEYRHIREYPNNTPFIPYLIDCNVLITDYSSAMIDAYLMSKPCVLFDKSTGYLQTRGMYLDYPGEYCSRYATDEKTLLELIRAADGLTETEQECVRRVAGKCDGHAAKRVCDLIRSIL